MEPDFSIVTPSFNQAQFVGRTLESVRDQKGVALQHIVVDPGSTDNSKEIVRRFPHATLLEKSDSCQSEGINNGFSECRGKYMSWLNSDDFYPSQDILAQVKICFEENTTVDVVYGNAIFVDAAGDFIREYFVNGKTENLLETLEYQVGICQPAVFWRRSVYERLGGLDESLDYQLDYEYWIRLAQSGFRWKHVHMVLAAHRWWEGMKTASKRDSSLRESLNLVKKKFGYVHFKWAERLAALELTGSDGIINVNSPGDIEVRRHANELLRKVNSDSVTLELLASEDAGPGKRDTLSRLLETGCDINPRFFDAKKIDWTDDNPRYVFPDDERHPSVARRPEIRRSAATGSDHVIYSAEPGYSVAQPLGGFQADQISLRDYLGNTNLSSRDTCVVVANGPSLRHSLHEDLFSLDMIISNFAYKDERLLNHAKYFTIVNHTVAAQVYSDWMLLDGITKVFPFWIGRHIPRLANTYFVNSTVVPEFSGDATRYLSWRSTVSYFNMQLAYSLGYRRILLVGFDNSYVQPPTVREGDELHQTSDDPNHFMNNYFKGKTWQAADTGNMNDSYCEALLFGMRNGVEIINCTVGGQLHVFPRSTLASLRGECQDDATRSWTDGCWRKLTPGEISAVARYPEAKYSFTGDLPASYASMPAPIQEFLLEEAKRAGREVVAPYYHIDT